MITRTSWDDFRQSGLAWWVNRTLHLFGWTLCFEVDRDGRVLDAYPAKTGFRGFTTEDEEKGFEALTRHIGLHIEQLKSDAGVKE